MASGIRTGAGRVSTSVLPDPAKDERSDSTALAVAIGGVMCPVPFLMSAAAIRMTSSPARSRRATTARLLSFATIAGQFALIGFLLLR
jgi:hypothetical protein